MIWSEGVSDFKPEVHKVQTAVQNSDRQRVEGRQSVLTKRKSGVRGPQKSGIFFIWIPEQNV